MTRRLNRAFLLVPITGLLVTAATSASQTLGAGAAAPTLTKVEKRLYIGVGPDQFSDPTSTAARSAAPRASSAVAAPFSNFTPASSGGPQCGLSLGSNVKVNQGCLNITAAGLQGRGQAQNETAIAVNPFNPQQLVAASNDYVLGDGLAGGIRHSSDGGKTWQDSTLPVEFTRGSDFAGDTAPRMYWQGGGDPSLAWDTHGNVYFSGLHFNRGTPPIGASDIPEYSSAVYVYRSIGNGGASWTFPGTPVATSFSPTTPGSGLPLLDKPYIAIDNHVNSPFRDRIYVTFSNFQPDGTGYINEAWSSDFGRTFSAPVLVSRNSSTLCPNDYSAFGVVSENGNACNQNQFSDPFTGADGNLYVVYANYNTNQATDPTANADNRTQILLAKSTNGGVSFGAPVQVGFYYDLPDCGTYQGQDEFRACIPERGAQQHSVFRAANYPSGAVDPTNNRRIAVTYGSYINRSSNESTGCSPNGVDQDVFVQLYNGVKTGCANKIMVSVSNNRGASFSATGADPREVTVVPQQAAQASADQFWQWSAFDNHGRIVVSYYDRQYGSDITNGSMDITLSTEASGEGENARSSDEGNQLRFASQRVTTSSMPTPTEFPDAQGNSVFFGDYSGLAVADVAHPLWMDTRQPDLFDCGTNPPAVCTATAANGNQANNEDLFTDSIRP